jgi:CRISPR/Cas system-associated exonuclease Cas4 (RecB family)
VRLQSAPPVIEKTEKILAMLKIKTFSSSAIDDYITCPALFYYKQILKFEEKKALGDDIEAIDRGTIIHSILHDTFDGYLNREITPALYKEMLSKMKKVIERHFEAREASGDYYFFKKITAFKLESFLKKNIDEAKDRPFIVKYLETNIEDTMNINGHRIQLKGRIDRVDYCPRNNEYIIADYKTGGTKQYPRSIVKQVDFQSMQEIHKHVNSFQLPIYTYLFINRFDIPLADTNAKLILLRNNDEEMLFGGLARDEKEAAFARYMQGVATVINDLLDPAKPFTPFDTDSCSTCAFNNLCHV